MRLHVPSPNKSLPRTSIFAPRRSSSTRSSSTRSSRTVAQSLSNNTYAALLDLRSDADSNSSAAETSSGSDGEAEAGSENADTAIATSNVSEAVSEPCASTRSLDPRVAVEELFRWMSRWGISVGLDGGSGSASAADMGDGDGDGGSNSNSATSVVSSPPSSLNAAEVNGSISNSPPSPTTSSPGSEFGYEGGAERPHDDETEVPQDKDVVFYDPKVALEEFYRKRRDFYFMPYTLSRDVTTVEGVTDRVPATGAVASRPNSSHNATALSTRKTNPGIPGSETNHRLSWADVAAGKTMRDSAALSSPLTSASSTSKTSKTNHRPSWADVAADKAVWDLAVLSSPLTPAVSSPSNSSPAPSTSGGKAGVSSREWRNGASFFQSGSMPQFLLDRGVHLPCAGERFGAADGAPDEKGVQNSRLIEFSEEEEKTMLKLVMLKSPLTRRITEMHVMESVWDELKRDWEETIKHRSRLDRNLDESKKKHEKMKASVEARAPSESRGHWEELRLLQVTVYDYEEEIEALKDETIALKHRMSRHWKKMGKCQEEMRRALRDQGPSLSC